MATSNLIKNLPKTDLHRHIEGSVSPKTLKTLYQKTTTKTKPQVYFKNLLTLKHHSGSLNMFITKLATPYLKKYILTPQDLCFVFEEALKDAAADHVSRLELRFCPSNFLTLDNSVETLLTKISESLSSQSKKLRIKSGLIFCFKRDDDEKLNLMLAKTASRLFQKKLIVGTDLAGNEHFYANKLFTKLARAIHKAGIPFTVHAGEASGAESVKSAINLLGAHRIGHGVRAAQDPKVLELIKKKNVPLEICPTSNLDTGVYKSYQQIPFATFLKHKIPFTIATDDPVTSGITLSGEIQNLINLKIITLAQYKQTLITARTHSFLK